jgi:hypothetical protein
MVDSEGDEDEEIERKLWKGAGLEVYRSVVH